MPILIAITGGSGSGKSTLAEALVSGTGYHRRDGELAELKARLA